MRYYKKAIKKYRAEREQNYAEQMQEDMSIFTAKIKAMRATGKCQGVVCRCCPLSIAGDYEDPAAEDIHCGHLEAEVVKKIVNKRVRRK